MLRGVVGGVDGEAGGGLAALAEPAGTVAGALAFWASKVVQLSTTPSAAGTSLFNIDVYILLVKLFGFGQLSGQLIRIEPVFIGKSASTFDGPILGADPNDDAAIRAQKFLAR